MFQSFQSLGWVLNSLHSRGQQLCKLIATKESVYKKKNSTPTGLNGLGNQHDGRDVM